MDQRYDQRAVSDTASQTKVKTPSTSRSSSTATKCSNNPSQALRPKIELGPEEERLLLGLHLRVRDAASENPILEDTYASELLEKIDYDISRSTFKLDPTYVQYACGRAKQIDRWAQDFLDQHTFEDVLVLQLACGLDSRFMRLGRRKDVKWVDVDRPNVTNLRRRLIPHPGDGDYSLLSASVADDDDAWLRRIPADRPTLIIMEGLTYYLEPDKGVRLFQRLLGHFSHGNLVFDTLGSLGVVFTHLLDPGRKVDARFRWGINDAGEIKKLDPRLVLRDRIFSHDYMDAGPFAKGYPPMFGGWTPLISLLPGFKKNGQFLHFEF